MKRLLVFLFIVCLYVKVYAAENFRSIIVLFDWDKELISRDLNDGQDDSWGPPSGNLITALQQQAAPIIVTSTLWHNFVARRKLFKDFFEGNGKIYKNKYQRFSSDNAINKFQSYVKAYSQGVISRESDSYFLCYKTTFNEQDWIIKKVSDYIYLLVPTEYLKSLQFSVVPKKPYTFKYALSENDLRLGLKIDKMINMSYKDALDPSKHRLSLGKVNYTQLLTKKDAAFFTKLESKGIVPPEATIMSNHFIKLLPDIFVTKWDLVDKNNNGENTEKNKADYSYSWLAYVDGHGSESGTGVLKKIDLDNGFSIEFAYLGGLELLAFREWLAFLNNSIKTQFLFYSSCYSGGKHLQKLYEHEWDYSAGNGRRVEQKSDIFNYMIVTANVEYTPTLGPIPGFRITMIENKKTLDITYPIQFVSFFNACKKYFTVDNIAVGQKKSYFDMHKKLEEEQKKLQFLLRGPYYQDDFEKLENTIVNTESVLENLKFITLNALVVYVHDSSKLKHRPAVRYAGTEWFVPLPEEDRSVSRVRVEAQEQKKLREKEEIKTKKLLEEHLKKERKEPPQSPVNQVIPPKVKPTTKPKIEPKGEPQVPQNPMKHEDSMVASLMILKQKLTQLQRIVEGT